MLAQPCTVPAEAAIGVKTGFQTRTRRSAVTHSWETWRVVRQAKASVKAGAFLLHFQYQIGRLHSSQSKKPAQYRLSGLCL